LGISHILGVDTVVVCTKLQCDTENTERDLYEGSIVSTENIPRLEGTGYLAVGTSGVDVGSGYQSAMLFDGSPCSTGLGWRQEGIGAQ